MADAAKIKGKVKWFDPRKGYGFITDENGKDHFCHFSGIEKGRHYTGFEDGDEVEFTTTEDGKKGTQATEVVLLNEKKPERKKKGVKTEEGKDVAEGEPSSRSEAAE